MSKLFQLQNVEHVAIAHEKYKEPIARWLNGDMRPDDHSLMIEIVDNALPDDQILWPPWVMISVDKGHITLAAHILDIIAKA